MIPFSVSAPDTQPEIDLVEIVEMDLLLPGWQVAALDEVAHQGGATAGQIVRLLIEAFLDQIAKRTAAAQHP